MKQIAPYIIILCVSLVALYYKSELKLWRSNYDYLIQEYNAHKTTVWDKLPSGVSEYKVDTVFMFWDNEPGVVKGRQTFKIQ